MAAERNVYLKMKTLEEARKILFDSFPPSGILSHEILPVPEAVGRVLSKPITAKLCLPSLSGIASPWVSLLCFSQSIILLR